MGQNPKKIHSGVVKLFRRKSHAWGLRRQLLESNRRQVRTWNDQFTAIMIPNDVEEFQTEGERVFFWFLQSVAKPDSRYVTRYLPDTN